MHPNFRCRPLHDGPSSCGFFDLLPLEVVIKIFDASSLADVGTVALCSEGMRLRVVSWISSKRCQNKILDPLAAFPLTEASDAQESKEAIWSRNNSNSNLCSYAILCKRVTCLYNTRDRVHFAFRQFETALKRQELKETWSGRRSTTWLTVSRILRFFSLFHTFIRGWDESEFICLLHLLNKKFMLEQRITLFFSCPSRQEACIDSEMNLRLLCRCLTWDLVGKDYSNRAGWILTLLKFLVGNNPRNQALFFLVVFGCSCNDYKTHFEEAPSLSRHQRIVLSELMNHTDWEKYSDYAALDYTTGKEMFFTLAQAVCSCINLNSKWKDTMVNPMLEMMFTIPKPWDPINIAGFLLFCNEQLITFHIISLLKKGDPESINTAVTRVVKMIIASFHFENKLCHHKGIGKVFDEICKFPMGQTREKFFDALSTTFLAHLQADLLGDQQTDELLISFSLHIANQQVQGERTEE